MLALRARRWAGAGLSRSGTFGRSLTHHFPPSALNARPVRANDTDMIASGVPTGVRTEAHCLHLRSLPRVFPQSEGEGVAMELARLIDALSRPAAYAHPVEVRQTHISVVFLAGAFVYKVKKPVALGFVDFRDPSRRRHFCAEEVRRIRLAIIPIPRPERRGDAALPEDRHATPDGALMERCRDQILRLSGSPVRCRLPSAPARRWPQDFGEEVAAGLRPDTEAILGGRAIGVGEGGDVSFHGWSVCLTVFCRPADARLQATQ